MVQYAKMVTCTVIIDGQDSGRDNQIYLNELKSSEKANRSLLLLVLPPVFGFPLPLLLLLSLARVRALTLHLDAVLPTTTLSLLLSWHL